MFFHPTFLVRQVVGTKEKKLHIIYGLGRFRILSYKRPHQTELF